MFKFFILFLLIISSGCVDRKFEVIKINQKIELNVEVAKTNEELARGLMFRDKLDENNGMIFIFPDEKQRIFWMKNTKIPLDILFLFENGTINEIKRDVQPCYQDPCIVYPSKYPSKYVIEVNANYTIRKNISVGDQVKIK